MTTNHTIATYKNKLALKLISIDGLVSAMGNLDIDEPDEALYTYIFPYFHVPETIESAHSYILFKIEMIGPSSENSYIDNYVLTVWVVVNQKLMKMDFGGMTRAEYLSDLIEKELNFSEFFGTRQLKLVSNTEGNMDLQHRMRTMIFKTQDLNDELGCK